jgi:putative endonuclease
MTVRFDAAAALCHPVQLDLPLPTGRAAPAVHHTRHLRGQQAYLSGLAAESSVERRYLGQGRAILARRWRGSRAEIDMIVADGATIVFVEVKKSRSFDAAIQSFGRAQQRRILQAAEEYLGSIGMGQLTDMRFDLALVDGQGAIDVIENAFGGWD